jgi:hypothetical protein
LSSFPGSSNKLRLFCIDLFNPLKFLFHVGPFNVHAIVIIVFDALSHIMVVLTIFLVHQVLPVDLVAIDGVF